MCLSVHSTAFHFVLGLLNGWEVSVVGALLPEIVGGLLVWVCGLSFEGAGPPVSPWVIRSHTQPRMVLNVAQHKIVIT